VSGFYFLAWSLSCFVMTLSPRESRVHKVAQLVWLVMVLPWLAYLVLIALALILGLR